PRFEHPIGNDETAAIPHDAGQPASSPEPSPRWLAAPGGAGPVSRLPEEYRRRSCCFGHGRLPTAPATVSAKTAPPPVGGPEADPCRFRLHTPASTTTEADSRAAQAALRATTAGRRRLGLGVDFPSPPGIGSTRRLNCRGTLTGPREGSGNG